MPRKLLSKEQRKYFGKFSGIPSEEQLSEYFFLDDNDLAIIDELRTETNKLGFAVQLGVLRFIGTFPRSFDDVSYAVVEYVSKQLTINSHNFLDYFKKTLKNTRTNHINPDKRTVWLSRFFFNVCTKLFNDLIRRSIVIVK